MPTARNRVTRSGSRGADFSRFGKWGYHPLMIALGQTNELLRLVNRPGCSHDTTGLDEHLVQLLPMIQRRFERVIFRGDAAFYRNDTFQLLDRHDAELAVVARASATLQTTASQIAEKDWSPFVPRANRGENQGDKKSRKQAPDERQRKVEERGLRSLQLVKQWACETTYTMSGGKQPLRLIIRRQLIEDDNGQDTLFESYRYRFVITNIWDLTPEEVLDITYQRCDDENVIKQLKNDIAALRMPTGTMLANAAFMTCARLAFNMKSWLCMLALPDETARWHFSRFRRAFVNVVARVVSHARSIVVRISSAHRHHSLLLRAYHRL